MYSHTIGGAFVAACCLPRLVTASSPVHHTNDNPSYSFDELWSLERSFWDTFQYPANLAQINATDDSVFAENVFPASRQETTTRTDMLISGPRSSRHHTNL
jgi:hypothetical protein